MYPVPRFLSTFVRCQSTSSRDPTKSLIRRLTTRALEYEHGPIRLDLRLDDIGHNRFKSMKLPYYPEDLLVLERQTKISFMEGLPGQHLKEINQIVRRACRNHGPIQLSNVEVFVMDRRAPACTIALRIIPSKAFFALQKQIYKEVKNPPISFTGQLRTKLYRAVLRYPTTRQQAEDAVQTISKSFSAGIDLGVATHVTIHQAGYDINHDVELRRHPLRR